MNSNAPVDLSELLAEVRRIEVQSKRLVASALAGGYRSVFRGSGLEFDEVREYVPGDDPRSVDWNVTARVGKPFIKKFVDERELTVVFLLDLSASMETGFSHWSMRQMAARICGCLALSAVRNHDKVGFIGFSSKVEKYVPPRKGTRHALSIVRDCLALPAADEKTDLRSALDFASGVLRRHATVFLISDFWNDGWQKSISICSRRHDLVAVRLLPPELSQLPAGMIHLKDPETGKSRWVDGQHAATQAAYQQQLHDWQKRTEVDLRKAKVDLMDVPVPLHHDADAIARPIYKFFRMREQRGAKR